MTTENAMVSAENRGRRSKFNDDVAAKIADAIAEGENMANAAKLAGVSPRTVYYWARKYPDFLQRYAHAREDQAELMLDRVLHVASTPKIAEKVTITDEGTTVVRFDDVQARRLEVDTLKWAMGKLAPKKYGERLFNEITAQISIEERSVLQTAFNEAIGFGRVIEHDTAEDSEGIKRT